MIIYSTESDTCFTDYGILIPVRYKKAKKVYESLSQGIMASIDEALWLCSASNKPVDKEVLLLCHTERYVNNLMNLGAEKEILQTYELLHKDCTYNRYNPSIATRPLSDLVQQNLINAAACCEAGEIALKTGFAYFLGGGSHHAMADYGSGFCLINDVVLIARYLQSKNLAKNIWIIDVDAHKGDGTAALTSGDDSIRSLSIHMKNGWPLDSSEYREDGSFNPSWTKSDIDIAIARGEEAEYTARLLKGLLEMKNRFLLPDIAIIVGGVDPYEKDELASTSDLKLTKEQLLERDLLVYNFFKEMHIPQVHVMAGGYGQYSWEIYVNFLEKVLSERYC